MAAVSQQVVPVAPVAQPMGSSYNARYNVLAGMVTGIVQLVCSVLLILLGAIAYIIVAEPLDYGASIWSAVLFFLPAGILGIISRNRNSTVIGAYMVMSILSSIESFIVFIFQVITATALPVPFALIATVFVTEFIASVIASIYGCAGPSCDWSNTTNTTAPTTTTAPYLPGTAVATQPSVVVAQPPYPGPVQQVQQYPMPVLAQPQQYPLQVVMKY